ncbi:hypothetical protein IVA95_23460 [Bradyrhizobium sp. 157]|uniref:hypothetical protein n=1 Tax=Bradyrhizobium sp. 157 TaxID=2782631 RepID=UPI001FF957E8|nr:hypothetical protein [Bradyrhizobium sp. 157]MCK1640460.1 hypothetical protein [Bradyrhizobium sp. 157]
MTNTLITPAPVVHTLEDGTVFSEKSRRCIRGIPIGRSAWFSRDGPAGEPEYANDNHRGRWPLMEEYRAGRLGKCESESKVLWSTAKWFAGVYQLANRQADACGNQYCTSGFPGELGETVDPRTGAVSEPEGIETERDPVQRWFGVDPNTVPAYGRELEALFRVEYQLQARKTCQHLKYRLDVNYRHVVRAVIEQAEMKDIAQAEGASGAAKGRAFVRAGLRTASLVRIDLARWEENETSAIGPLSSKAGVYPPSMRRAANDDMRRYVRDVAA